MPHGRALARSAPPARASRSPRSWLGVGITGMLVAIAPVSLDAAGTPGLGANPEAVRRALARHELRGASGERFDLGSLRGEVVVVNFWASWCRPCRQELPGLAKLHRSLVARGGRVVAVSIDHDARNARRFARTHAPGLPIVHDGPEGLARALDLRAIPFTLVLDRNGEVAYGTRGADDAALRQIGAIAGRLAAASPPVTGRVEGDTP